MTDKKEYTLEDVLALARKFRESSGKDTLSRDAGREFFKAELDHCRPWERLGLTWANFKEIFESSSGDSVDAPTDAPVEASADAFPWEADASVEATTESPVETFIDPNDRSPAASSPIYQDDEAYEDAPVDDSVEVPADAEPAAPVRRRKVYTIRRFFKYRIRPVGYWRHIPCVRRA